VSVSPCFSVSPCSPPPTTRSRSPPENLLLTALSLLPCLAIGYWVSALFMDSFSSDLFDFGLQMRSRMMLFSAGAILAVSLLAQWPVSRSVNALDTAQVVRERSQ
jgi:zinc transporter ZupT